MTGRVSIIVHGGAWNIPEELKQAHVDAVSEACEHGYNLLAEQGESYHRAIDVAQKVIEMLESCPVLNCARGSPLNADGYVEMDAFIGDDKYNFGAVMGLKSVLHPIRVARAVRDRTEHLQLAGEGANKFAEEIGEEKVDLDRLLVDRELQLYKESLKSKAQAADEGTVGANSKIKLDTNNQNPDSIPVDEKMEKLDKCSDTVGVVCRDRYGDIAVALSTGGTPMKVPGRVGDTPVWGAGGYALKGCGAASTGHGEDLLRILLAKTVVDSMLSSKPGTAENAVKCAREGVEFMENEIKGSGGVICMDSEGNPGFWFNTEAMAFAFKVEGDERGLVTGVNHCDKL